MSTTPIIIYILIGFLIGTLCSFFLDKNMLSKERKRGYLHGVDDVLNNHIFKDAFGKWHQLSITWRDLDK